MLRRAYSIVKWSLIALGAVAGLTIAALYFVSEAQPRGEPGPRAEALADRVLAAIDHASWAKTGAVRWRLAASRPLITWDRSRHLAILQQSPDAPATLLDLSRKTGVVRDPDGTVRSGPEVERQVADGYAIWANDSFWLNAPALVRAPGTERRLVDDESGDALLISYGTGGITPGDTYLWLLDDNDRPRAWKMWVSILPIGGATISWDGWLQLATGAWVSTKHEGLGLTLELTDLAAAEKLEQLSPGPDPFAPLLEGDEPGTEQTASRPLIKDR